MWQSTQYVGDLSHDRIAQSRRHIGDAGAGTHGCLLLRRYAGTSQPKPYESSHDISQRHRCTATRSTSPAPTEAVKTRTPEASPTPIIAPIAEPSANAEPAEISAGGVTAISEEQLEEELRGARFSTRGWRTNFRIRSISYEEIRGGGPSKDGIPPIDNPRFETVQQADQWLDDMEPVQVVNINGDARAYPVQIMMWHEIVNDNVGGEPVVITY